MTGPPNSDNARGRRASAQSKKQCDVKPTPPRQDEQAARCYSVVVDKKPGVRIIFSTKLEKHAAELICVRLAAIGCIAHCVPMMMIDAPGMQRRR
jgi:hypothetical protein